MEGIKTLRAQPVVAAQNHLQQIASSTHVFTNTHTCTLQFPGDIVDATRWLWGNYLWFLLSQYFNSHLGRKYCAWKEILGLETSYFWTISAISVNQTLLEIPRNYLHSVQPFIDKTSFALLREGRNQNMQEPAGLSLAKLPTAQPHQGNSCFTDGECPQLWHCTRHSACNQSSEAAQPPNQI